MAGGSIVLGGSGSILFIGNSFTFGRANPVLSYNTDEVRDLTDPARGGTFTNTTGSNAFEPHPWGGIPGIFKEFADQAGLTLDVALSTRNAASLQGHYLNSNPAGWDLRGNLASQKWDTVVLQDNSTQPLPSGAGSITFAAGSSTATLTLDPTGDAKVETDETIGIRLAAGTGYTVGTAATVAGTILNDDPTGPSNNPALPTVTLVASPATALEDGTGKLVYTFTRTGPTTQALVISFAAARDGATSPSVATSGANQDFDLVAGSVFDFRSGASTTPGGVSFTNNTGTITIAAGQTTATLTLDPKADTVVEPDESIRLTLSANAAYNVGTQGAVQVTILNDDYASPPTTPVITLSSSKSAVFENGTDNLVWEFTRTGSNAQALTVNFATEGTATLPGGDFTVAGANSFTTGGADSPNLASFNTYAVKLAQYAKTGAADQVGSTSIPANPNANPATDVYLYETWARPNMVVGARVSTTDETTGAVTVSPTVMAPEYYLDLESMTADLRAAYEGLAAANPIFKGVAPVGAAFLQAVQGGTATRNPYAPDATTDGKIDLWFDDNFHPSKYGSYLSALTLFGTITGLDPRSLGAGETAASDLGIAPAEAVALQRVAAATLGLSLQASWTSPGQVTELAGAGTGTLASAGAFSFSDADASDAHTVTFTPLTAGALGTFTAALRADTTGDGTGGAVNWLYTVDASAVEFLDAGQSRVERFLVTLTETGGFQATREIAVTINGTADAPAITSDGGGATASLSVAEGTLAVTTVTATDRDIGALTYAIAGGADAALFEIEAASGTLSFRSAPDFEQPADVAGDNLYDVVVQVSDGSNVASQRLSVRVTDANDPPVLGGDGAVSVLQGGTVVIGTADLTSTDQDAGATATYTVLATVRGSVLRGGVAATTFTEAELAAGQIAFRQDGSRDPAASFTVTVSDGTAVAGPRTVAAAVDLVPAVTGIAYGANDGTLRAGETVTFAVAVSEPVAVSGSPTLSLNSGGTAVFVPGSSTATSLIFAYTAKAGENAADLAVTALGLAGGAAIRDSAGQALAALPAGGINPAGTLAVDTVAPAVTLGPIAGDDVLNGAEAQGAITVSGTAPGAEDGQSVTVAVRSADGLQVFASTTAAVSGGAWSLSFPANTGTALPDRTYLVTADVADRAGNPAAQASRTLLVDKFADQPPAATLVVNATPDGIVNAAEAAAVAYTVAGLDADAIAVATFTDGALVRSAAVAANGSFLIDLAGLDGQVTSRLAITDARGNTASAVGNAVAFDVLADRGAPVRLSVDGTANGVVDLFEARQVRVSVSGLDADARAVATLTDGVRSVLAAFAADGSLAVDLSGFDGSVQSRLAVTDLAGNAASVAGDTIRVDADAFRGLFGTVITDAAGPAGAVYELYAGLLGRAPDAGGYGFQLERLENGASLADVAAGMLASPEYVARNGPVAAESDRGFVDELYRVALGRTGDPAGIADWLAELGRGVPRAEVALRFALSPENLAQDAGALAAGVFAPDPTAGDVARLYYGILDRAPDAGGLAAYTAFVRSGGGSDLRVAEAMLASPEYQARFGARDAATFIDDLYDGALGRDPDPAGLAFYEAALASGQSRAAVALAISDSPEANAVRLGEIETGWHVA